MGEGTEGLPKARPPLPRVVYGESPSIVQRRPVFWPPAPSITPEQHAAYREAMRQWADMVNNPIFSPEEYEFYRKHGRFPPEKQER